VRHVARTEGAPAELVSTGEDERERARAHHRAPSGGVVAGNTKKKKNFEYTAYKLDVVKRELERLFHGKCAYCETYYSALAPVDVEHYRPKGAVSEDPEHPGYWWLAMSWDNLLPSCIDCNRKRKQRVVSNNASLHDLYTESTRHATTTVQAGKKDSFPLAPGGTRCRSEDTDLDTEQPLLLDPTRDRPADHLGWYLTDDEPIALIYAREESTRGERARVSIHTYGLNRLGLVQERTRVLRRLIFLGEVVTELGTAIDALRLAQVAGANGIAQRLQTLQDGTLVEMRSMADPEAPYSMMARAWIERFVATIVASMAAPRVE
jgi:uncharacterized protein (TIGR02646 family)